MYRVRRENLIVTVWRLVVDVKLSEFVDCWAGDIFDGTQKV